MRSKRRDFLKTISALPMVPLMRHGIGWSDFSEGTDSPIETSLQQIGKIKIKTPWEIAKSPFGIGCETLDRELWDPKEIYPWMNDLSVKWARLQTGWARVERIKEVYDWKWLDESVDGLIERGFKPFFNVGYGNPNYNDGDGARGYHPLVNVETYSAWKKFVRALTIRYKNKIQYYEIWNEPNLGGFWSPGGRDPGRRFHLGDRHLGSHPGTDLYGRRPRSRCPARNRPRLHLGNRRSARCHSQCPGDGRRHRCGQPASATA